METSVTFQRGVAINKLSQRLFPSIFFSWFC